MRTLFNQNSVREVENLELALDKLALISHFLDDIPEDEKEYPEAPARNYSRWRELIGNRFPSLVSGAKLRLSGEKPS